MRWKLANGGVVGTTKQPIQWRDFDRIEISDNYASWVEDYGTFEDNGGPIENGDLEITIKFYNPSTRTIRKSRQPHRGFSITVGTDTLGNRGSGYSNKDPYFSERYFEWYLQNLSYGYSGENYFYPFVTNISDSYSHTVNPFENNWYGQFAPIDHGLQPYENYNHSTYEYYYEVQFRRNSPIGGRNHGGRSDLRKVLKRIEYSITYAIK